jgi:hypothetical protein
MGQRAAARFSGGQSMMGKRQVHQDALFYEFSLERHVPESKMGEQKLAQVVATRKFEHTHADRRSVETAGK